MTPRAGDRVRCTKKGESGLIIEGWVSRGSGTDGTWVVLRGYGWALDPYFYDFEVIERPVSKAGIEAAAKALADSGGGLSHWDDLAPDLRRAYEERATTAIQAYLEAVESDE